MPPPSVGMHNTKLIPEPPANINQSYQTQKNSKQQLNKKVATKVRKTEINLTERL